MIIQSRKAIGDSLHAGMRHPDIHAHTDQSHPGQRRARWNSPLCRIRRPTYRASFSRLKLGGVAAVSNSLNHWPVRTG